MEVEVEGVEWDVEVVSISPYFKLWRLFEVSTFTC